MSLRHRRRERFKQVAEAVLGVRVVTAQPERIGRTRPTRGQDEFSWVPRHVDTAVLRVWITPTKEILVDLADLAFKAPRWGYAGWTPLFRDDAQRFFRDLSMSEEPSLKRELEGQRRVTLDDYLRWRERHWACRSVSDSATYVYQKEKV